MARPKNDGKGRMGGRQKGTPNKATGNLRDFIKSMLEDNREKIQETLEGLRGEEYLRYCFTAMRFVVSPPTSADESADTQSAIDKSLDDLNNLNNLNK